MNARDEVIANEKVNKSAFHFDVIFQTRYERITRLIARVVRDTARAEELGVEVFWRLWRNPQLRDDTVDGWLYRTAVRLALDELRSRSRRERFERLFFERAVPTPEDLHAAAQEQEKVRAVLAGMPRRTGALLLLQSEGLSYTELAAALEINPASVGTLLARARQAFRKEYIKRYGER